MLDIPLAAGENQVLKAVLGGQLCQITVYGNSQGLFLDLSVNGVYARYSALCLNNAQMVTESYLGFNGRLMFIDTQGNEDPKISGIGQRWRLRFLEKGVDF